MGGSEACCFAIPAKHGLLSTTPILALVEFCFVREADFGYISGLIHSVICPNYKTGTLGANQQAHLFVAEKGKML